MKILTGAARPNDIKEVLRYLGVKRADDNTLSVIAECEKELLPVVELKACYDVYGVSIEGSSVDLGFVKVDSKSLSAHLRGCKSAVVFACTAGVGADRLAAKYSRLSPARAAVVQALGAATVERWCDTLNEKFAEELGSRRTRFSCGYGDLTLSMQRDIFAALGVTKNLGVTLSDNLFMTPTKSVTAIVGIE